MLGELGKTWMSFRDVRDVLMCVNLYKILGVKTTFFTFSAINGPLVLGLLPRLEIRVGWADIYAFST